MRKILYIFGSNKICPENFLLGHYNEITSFSSLSPEYKHVGGRLLSLFIIVVSLARQTEQFVYGYRFQVALKDLPQKQHRHKQLLRSDTPFYITGIL